MITLELRRDHVLIVVPDGDTDHAFAVPNDGSEAYRRLRAAAEASSSPQALVAATRPPEQGAPQTITDDAPTPIEGVPHHPPDTREPDTWVDALVNVGRDAREYVNATPDAQEKISRGLGFLRSASGSTRMRRGGK